MPLSVQPGFAFTNKPIGRYPRHLHFALTNADREADGRFLLVNFTTDPKSGCPSMVVEPDEYAWLTRPSMVAFSLATLPCNPQIESAVLNGLLDPEAPVPPALVGKVRLALLASVQAEARLKAFLRARMT